jgi:homoserine dehydrogenase
MSVEVLKFGSSVLRSAEDLPVAVDEIYRRWRSGCRVLAVVSAFEGVTDQLLSQASSARGGPNAEAIAAYVATGEQQTAALLLSALQTSGIPARIVDPRDIGLHAEGSFTESIPTDVDIAALDRAWRSHAVLVLPGFYGIDRDGRTVLFGRGGSDLSALFLAANLRAACRLVKDVRGVFDADPASSSHAHRFSALSWPTAINVAGPLIQPKALKFAQQHGLRFEVGRPNESTCTRVGHVQDEWARPGRPARALNVALVGCGIVGRGVYESIRGYPSVFELRHVVVREPHRYPEIENITTDVSVLMAAEIDVVIVCTTATPEIPALIDAILGAGKVVITANKAAVVALGSRLDARLSGKGQRLYCSSAVGGAVPILETLARLRSPVREIRGIVNGTCGAVLDAWAAGSTREDAIRAAQVAGFAEADPSRDLSGQDSADKLILMTAVAFGEWLSPADISTQGIDGIEGSPAGLKLIARATRQAGGILTASVAPHRPAADSFLGLARGAENRVEIELESGEILRLRGQGAGRWPTTASIMGDLHDVARRIEGEVARSTDDLPRAVADVAS